MTLDAFLTLFKIPGIFLWGCNHWAHDGPCSAFFFFLTLFRADIATQ